MKGKQIYGYDFHRQKPLLNYIVDFYCYELKLVIELDGHYHNNEEAYNKDLNRDAELQAYNLTVLRFNESDVLHDLSNVLRTIETYILEYQTNEEHTPNPSREGN